MALTLRLQLRIAVMAAALIAAPFALPVLAWADECGDAVLDYNTVLSRLDDAMERYRTCVADSKGTDDCAQPFRSLQRAHGQFAAAVAIYVKSCR